MIHTYQHGCMTCHTSAIVFTCDIRFFACWYWLNRIFSSRRFYFFHEPPVSPIMGASDIGQVSTAKSSIYFKYCYLLKISTKYFPFVKHEKYKDILDLEGAKIQDPKIHHILYQWCVASTHKLMEKHYSMIAQHTNLVLCSSKHFCTVEISS